MLCPPVLVCRDSGVFLLFFLEGSILTVFLHDDKHACLFLIFFTRFNLKIGGVPESKFPLYT